MDRIIYSLCILLFMYCSLNAQQKDSTLTIQEVLVKAQKEKQLKTPLKTAVNLDEMLASFPEISFIKRGAYAWEPLLNGMGNERSSITLDGMHIFGACTDKMDPMTSYIELNSLSDIQVSSGQQGAKQGSNIAGGIDLRSKRTDFGLSKRLNGTYQTGFELNNKQYFNLVNIGFSSESWTVDASFAQRKASNYTDGRGIELNHSQFQKINSRIAVGYRSSPRTTLRADVLFDVAKDVGFPALPMDLWLSRGLVSSLSTETKFGGNLWKSWENKVYFNTLEHYMDDTHRSENLVHMDMPGWSTNYGLLSKLGVARGAYQGELQLNAYRHLSIAEMRMYPQDRSERSMFAYTWPWVTSDYVGLSQQNTWVISDRSKLQFGGALALSAQRARYPEFNRIFYPDSKNEQRRILPSVYLKWLENKGDFYYAFGGGWGKRAPSVSESYGYYIYNSFDRYDYIGNPDLPSEQSFELNAQGGYKAKRYSLELTLNHFFIKHYIVGEILDRGSPMNYQSVGVKGYTALNQARLWNASIKVHGHLRDDLHAEGLLSYQRAMDINGDDLPFIRPLHYQASLNYRYRNWSFLGAVEGDAAQRHYSPVYGESPSEAYFLLNFSVQSDFTLFTKRLTVQLGVENLLDRYYSTYADWGNIPRMGRNLFSSLTFQL